MSLNFELHAKELLLYPILQNIEDGLIITDASLQIIFFNQTAERIYRIDAEQVLGHNLEILKPNLKIQQMVNNQQRFEKDKMIIRGEEVVITRGLLEASAGTFAAYAILHPVDSLREYQLNSLLDNPYEGIVVFNDKSEIIFANQTCYRFLKCGSKNQLGNEISRLVPRVNINQYMDKGTPVLGEILTIRNKQIELSYLPIVKHNQSLGIIVKSSLISREERNWGHMVENFQQGTATYYLDNIVGMDPSIIDQKNLAARAARTVSTVLITGESGTGKELFAHAIHNMSPRRKGPFIKVNCAGIPETLVESELFGYAEGSFTGALKEGKPGKFELANHGTIFLDEIGDMSMAMQAKLLRVLQEREVERVGGIHTTRIDVRVIAATNQDLSRLVKQGKFREDLYYRVNVIVLKIPPLRDRKIDIPLISKTLLQRLNDSLGALVDGIDDEVLDAFSIYDWPGNIRELENVLERAINFSNGTKVSIDNVPEHISNCKRPRLQIVPTEQSLEKLLAEHEKEVIIDALSRFNGNKSQAAQSLAINRSVLYRKMYKYNISI